MRTNVAEANVERMKVVKTNLAETSGASPPSLAELESKIGTGIRRLKSAWVEVGLALGEIRDLRLYLPLTFEDYLSNHPEWEITRRHADRIIKSARVAGAANQSKWSDWMPDVPNEAVARALAKLPEEDHAEIYAAACANCEGDEPTGRDIEEAAAKLIGNDDSETESDGTEAEAVGGPESEGECEDDDGDNDESKSGSGDDPTDDEEHEDYVHDYVVTISCRSVDSQALSAAVADFQPKINPLNTKFHFAAIWADDLARLFVALANVVEKLESNIDLRIKAGAE